MNKLYYSKKCKHCRNFLLELKSLNLLKDFKFICIDGNRNLPKFLREVPAIEVQDYNEPLQGDFAFKWIDYVKSQVAAKQIENEKPLDGFGSFGGLSGDNFEDLNGNSHGLGDFTAMDMIGQSIIDPNARTDDDNVDLNSRLEQMKKERGL